MDQTAIGNNRGTVESATIGILISLTLCHLLNDLMQSLLPALYPMLKDSFTLSFSQIGLITFTYQLTASLLQPVIGRYTDRRPRSYLLPVGMSFTLLELLLLSTELGRVPSRSLAYRPAGFRRTARLRAIALPGRRLGSAGPLLPGD